MVVTIEDVEAKYAEVLSAKSNRLTQSDLFRQSFNSAAKAKALYDLGVTTIDEYNAVKTPFDLIVSDLDGTETIFSTKITEYNALVTEYNLGQDPADQLEVLAYNKWDYI